MGRKKAKQKNVLSTVDRLHPWITLTAMILLPAAASNISQLTLAPLFGAIPSAVNHKIAITATFFAGVQLQHILPIRDRRTAVALLGAWIFYLPVIQWYLQPYNQELGLVGGPILHGFLTCHTIVLPSAQILAAEIQALAHKWKVQKSMILLVVVACIATAVFRAVEAFIQTHLLQILAIFPAQTPVQLQALLAVAYIVLNGNSRRALAWLAVPAVLHTAALNAHLSHVHRPPKS